MPLRKEKPVLTPQQRCEICRNQPDGCERCIERKRARNRDQMRRKRMAMAKHRCFRCLGIHPNRESFCPLAAEYEPTPPKKPRSEEEFWAAIGIPAETYKVHL